MSHVWPKVCNYTCKVKSSEGTTMETNVQIIYKSKFYGSQFVNRRGSLPEVDVRTGQSHCLLRSGRDSNPVFSPIIIVGKEDRIRVWWVVFIDVWDTVEGSGEWNYRHVRSIDQKTQVQTEGCQTLRVRYRFLVGLSKKLYNSVFPPSCFLKRPYYITAILNIYLEMISSVFTCTYSLKMTGHFSF